MPIFLEKMDLMSYMSTKIKIILTLSYHIYIVFNNKTYFDCLNLTEIEFLNFLILCIFSLVFCIWSCAKVKNRDINYPLCISGYPYSILLKYQ